MTQSM